MIRIRAIVKKEWSEMIRNRPLWLTSAILPAVFVVLPFLLLFGLGSLQEGQALKDPKMEQVAAALQSQSADLAALDIKSIIQAHVFRQFLLFLLLIPVMGAMTNATYSIVGEKQNRSLEPLLATPITVMELLAGKCVASAAPAILIGWAAAALYAAGIWLMSGPAVFAQVMNGMALIIIFLIAPLFGVLGLSVGVCVSTRANDPRSAQQIGAFAVIPIIGWMVGQFAGLFYLTMPALLFVAVVLIFADIVALGIGISLFQRETILTRWK